MVMSALSNMNSKTVSIVAGISAAAFLGYCIYFDRRRRSDPDFKAKLRERRRMAAKKASTSKGPALPGDTFNDIHILFASRIFDLNLLVSLTRLIYFFNLTLHDSAC